MQTEDLRYPIGKYKYKDTYTSQEVAEYISRIEGLPDKLIQEVSSLNEQQLDTPYRDGGWTVRQVVHHIADSHSNAYIRIKWTLTENTPLIKAYEEKLWAETPETKLPIIISIDLLKALHTKMVMLAKLISAENLSRAFIHPETKKKVSINHLLGMYAWHGEHHLAHIISLKNRMNWK